MMAVKKYLNQLEILRLKLEHKRKELKDIELNLGICGQGRGARVQTSFGGGGSNVAEAQAIRIADLKTEVRGTIIDYHEKQNLIINQIHGLNHSLYIEILYRRYVGGESNFEKMAEEMNYNYKYVVNKHAQALRAFERKYREVITKAC